jgi:hypothetical protein
MYAQDYSKANFVIGGGPGFPLGDISSFAGTGGHFIIGGGLNFSKVVGVDTEFMWHDLPINSATKELLQTPGASARQYAWTFNPIVHVPVGEKLGAYVIGGVGWYHRSGETTTPGAGVVCDPYWSWWYGCAIGTVDFATGTTGTATPGVDFTVVGGTLTFPSGARTRTFDVPIIDDLISEFNETVPLLLLNPIGSVSCPDWVVVSG